MRTTYIRNIKEYWGCRAMRLYSLFLCLFIFTACEKEGDKIYLSGLEESDFMVTETDVVLNKERSTEIVLSVAWKNSTLVVSNPNMSAPNLFSAYVQASTLEDFSSNIIETEVENESKAYTGAELNALAKNLSVRR
ncbi:SusE domain-containing protein [Bacteroides sp. OttesenSCG-928-M17]|nr:SusE domain-containing protein [Bacteroides sp. OttesenSCG-928-M17]